MMENPKRDSRMRLVYSKFSIAVIDREGFS